MVRIPARTVALPIPRPGRWRERRGPQCVAMGDVAGAAVVQPASVDFVLRGGTRMRALLARDCPALDYYSGLYISPNPDGMMCGGREAIRTRAGGQCPIARFRRLVYGE